MEGHAAHLGALHRGSGGQHKHIPPAVGQGHALWQLGNEVRKGPWQGVGDGEVRVLIGAQGEGAGVPSCGAPHIKALANAGQLNVLQPQALAAGAAAAAAAAACHPHSVLAPPEEHMAGALQPGEHSEHPGHGAAPASACSIAQVQPWQQVHLPGCQAQGASNVSPQAPVPCCILPAGIWRPQGGQHPPSQQPTGQLGGVEAQGVGALLQPPLCATATAGEPHRGLIFRIAHQAPSRLAEPQEAQHQGLWQQSSQQKGRQEGLAHWLAGRGWGSSWRVHCARDAGPALRHRVHAQAHQGALNQRVRLQAHVLAVLLYVHAAAPALLDIQPGIVAAQKATQQPPRHDSPRDQVSLGGQLAGVAMEGVAQLPQGPAGVTGEDRHALRCLRHVDELPGLQQGAAGPSSAPRHCRKVPRCCRHWVRVRAEGGLHKVLASHEQQQANGAVTAAAAAASLWQGSGAAILQVHVYGALLHAQQSGPQQPPQHHGLAVVQVQQLQGAAVGQVDRAAVQQSLVQQGPVPAPKHCVRMPQGLCAHACQPSSAQLHHAGHAMAGVGLGQLLEQGLQARGGSWVRCSLQHLRHSCWQAIGSSLVAVLPWRLPLLDGVQVPPLGRQPGLGACALRQRAAVLDARLLALWLQVLWQGTEQHALPLPDVRQVAEEGEWPRGGGGGSSSSCCCGLNGQGGGGGRGWGGGGDSGDSVDCCCRAGGQSLNDQRVQVQGEGLLWPLWRHCGAAKHARHAVRHCCWPLQRQVLPVSAQPEGSSCSVIAAH